ncbi:MAG: hypothetical protein AAF662_00460 [Pseudomonadota bacterium]
MNDEENEFLNAMVDVSPLKSDARVRLSKRSDEEAATSARRAAAVAQKPRDTNILVEDGIVPLDPWYIL